MNFDQLEIDIEALGNVTGGAGVRPGLTGPKTPSALAPNGPRTLPNGQAGPYKGADWWEWAERRGFPY